MAKGEHNAVTEYIPGAVTNQYFPGKKRSCYPAPVLPDYPFFVQGGRKNHTVSIIIDILSDLVKFEKDISVLENSEMERKSYLNF